MAHSAAFWPPMTRATSSARVESPQAILWAFPGVALEGIRHNCPAAVPHFARSSAARRLPGTITTNVLALERGARVFRVHDVAPVRDALAIAARLFFSHMLTDARDFHWLEELRKSHPDWEINTKVFNA